MDKEIVDITENYDDSQHIETHDNVDSKPIIKPAQNKVTWEETKTYKLFQKFKEIEKVIFSKEQ